jgi:DUF438 domain-containing protein
MTKTEIADLILNDLNHAVVFVDNNHIIRYMNAAAMKKYAKFGDLIGKSLLSCHNEKSRRTIAAYHEKMKDGDDEFVETQKGSRRVYIHSVRDPSGELLGYYEID